MNQAATDDTLVHHRERRVFGVIAGLLLLTAQCTAWAEASRDDVFSCGGKLESRVWQLWDGPGKAYMVNELADRLLQQGDTYALYEVQTLTHNLVSMARRCQRVERLEELARLFGVAYSLLKPYPRDHSSVAWICKGGEICSSKNGWLMNREVMLTSVQFLGLVSSIANGLAHATERDQGVFVEKTAIAGIRHLLRWGDDDALSLLDKQIKAEARDVRSGSSSELFFTDKELWMITIYAELAGILQQRADLRAKAGLTDREFKAMRAHFSRLLRLMAARITVKPAVDRLGKTVQVAHLDSGFWSLWDEFKYAAYTGSQNPVTCPGPEVKLKAPAPVDDLGWDIGHASRLVDAFDALERNRQAIQKVFGIKETALPPPETVNAFARKLVLSVWNGDAEFPLFSNYMNGANGWYRVAYDNGTGACSEGYPPFFLTDEFLTGGYATWARHAPELRPLARRLYRLTEATEGQELRFVDKYYPKLGVNASPGNSLLNRLMAWPSLVEARQ